MPTVKTMDILADRLFDDIDQLHDLTPMQRNQIVRYRAIFTRKLQHPYISNQKLAEMLSAEFGIKSLSQAYRDIGTVEVMLGNVRSSEKQWIRYLVVETLKEAIERAKDADNIKEMINAADKLGKYTRLDQEEQDPLPYEEIVPAQIEYMNDPTILGLPEPKEGGRAFIEKVMRRYIDAGTQDIEFEEVPHGK